MHLFNIEKVIRFIKILLADAYDSARTYQATSDPHFEKRLVL